MALFIVDLGEHEKPPSHYLFSPSPYPLPRKGEGKKEGERPLPLWERMEVRGDSGSPESVSRIRGMTGGYDWGEGGRRRAGTSVLPNFSSAAAASCALSCAVSSRWYWLFASPN
jgi:hypothetical protein